MLSISVTTEAHTKCAVQMILVRVNESKLPNGIRHYLSMHMTQVVRHQDCKRGKSKKTLQGRHCDGGLCTWEHLEVNIADQSENSSKKMPLKNRTADCDVLRLDCSCCWVWGSV